MTLQKRQVPVARLGALERAVMETLWDLTGPETDQSDATARHVVERLAASRSLAYTAELMLEALGRASDRDAALVRFVDAVSPEEAEVLRRALLGELVERAEPLE